MPPLDNGQEAETPSQAGPELAADQHLSSGLTDGAAPSAWHNMSQEVPVSPACLSVLESNAYPRLSPHRQQSWGLALLLIPRTKAHTHPLRKSLPQSLHLWEQLTQTAELRLGERHILERGAQGQKQSLRSLEGALVIVLVAWSEQRRPLASDQRCTCFSEKI